MLSHFREKSKKEVKGGALSAGAGQKGQEGSQR